MSTRTIDLANDIRKLLEMVENGEMSLEDLADTIDGIEGMMEDKFDATMSVLRETEVKQEACKKEAERYLERSKHWGRTCQSIRGHLLNCLKASGKKTFKTTFNTFSVKTGSISLVIDDIHLLPDEFVESRTEVIHDVQKDKIKKILSEALKATEGLKQKGEEIPESLLNPVPGAHVERGPETLAVR